MQTATDGVAGPTAGPTAVHDRLLSKAVTRLVRDTIARRRHRPTSSLPHPSAVRVSNAPPLPALRSGYRRRGALPRLHQILDQIALTQSPPQRPIAPDHLCHECGRLCDVVSARQCACGAVAHDACVSALQWYCPRWRCQVRQRADRLGVRLSTVPTARVEPKSEPRKPPPPTPPPEYPGVKAWRSINGFFAPVHDLTALAPTPAPAPGLYRVPSPELNYRDVWDEEDRAADADATTPRSMRYRQRVDASTAPAVAANLGPTSGRVARASFYLRFQGDGETPVLVRRHGAFRSLDVQYAVASALIQPGEYRTSNLPYIFPPPLYEPLTARFFLSGTPAPGDRRPRRPNASLHFFIEALADDDDLLQDAEDDDEICCELWLLRRHLEAQIHENNATKAWLRQVVAREWTLPRTADDDARAQRQRVLDAYLNRNKAPPPPSPPPVAAVVVQTPPPSPSPPALPEVTDFDRALAIASEPHACDDVSLDDLCRPVADKRVVLARPPTLATIVDFKSTDVVVEDHLNRLAVHEVVRSLVDSVAASLAAPAYALQDHVQFCFCRRPSDMSRWFLSCDICESWYHGACVGLADAAAEFVDQFVCSTCVRRSRRRTVLKQGYLQHLFLAAEQSNGQQGRLDAVQALSTLRIRIHRREEVHGVFINDGVRVEIDDSDRLLELIVPPPPPPVQPASSEHRSGPLRRSQREAAQWAITLNRMRDVEKAPALESYSKKRHRTVARIVSKTPDGVTLSVHGKRLGRPPKKLQQQEQQRSCSPPPRSPVVYEKRQQRLKRTRFDSMC